MYLKLIINKKIKDLIFQTSEDKSLDFLKNDIVYIYLSIKFNELVWLIKSN